MTSPTATITGRVVGPDGLGRMGRLTLTPTYPYEVSPHRTAVASRTSVRIDPGGYLVGPVGRSVPIIPGDYEIDLNIPGDLGVHLQRRIQVADGQELTLADLLITSHPSQPEPPERPAPAPSTPSTPSPQPPYSAGGGTLTSDERSVRLVPGTGALEALNSADVADLGDGVLTWRHGRDAQPRPSEHGVRSAEEIGVLEARNPSEVEDLGGGLLSWRSQTAGLFRPEG